MGHFKTIQSLKKTTELIGERKLASSKNLEKVELAGIKIV